VLRGRFPSVGLGGGGLAPGLELLGLEEREKPLIAIFGAGAESSWEGAMLLVFVKEMMGEVKLRLYNT